MCVVFYYWKFIKGPAKTFNTGAQQLLSEGGGMDRHLSYSYTQSDNCFTI